MEELFDSAVVLQPSAMRVGHVGSRASIARACVWRGYVLGWWGERSWAAWWSWWWAVGDRARA